jgi:hypothetical protein
MFYWYYSFAIVVYISFFSGFEVVCFNGIVIILWWVFYGLVLAY